VSKINPQHVRRLIIEQSYRANVGHIGSALCVSDILAALYDSILNIKNPHDPDRDRFILSKGHAALALYAVFHLKGWISQEELNTFHGNASSLGVHPEHALPGVDFSTGSLGQGLSVAVGAALAARLQKSTRNVYALLSDAELNEGSVWEAMMFAAQHKLSNLTVIIDFNGQQALNYTENVLDQSNMKDRWTAFGWNATEVDGHDFNTLQKVLKTPSSGINSKPRVLIAKTIFGKGVSYMEKKIKWHYLPMKQNEFEIAMTELEQSK